LITHGGTGDALTELSIFMVLPFLVLMGARMIYSCFSKRKSIVLKREKELEYKEAFSVGAALAFEDISNKNCSSF